MFGIKTGVALVATTCLAQAAWAEEVRGYNWSDYIEEELLEKFEAETGIVLIYDVFDSNEVLKTKLLAGQSGYDVVVPRGTFLQRQIPNASGLWEVIKERSASYDPDNAYSDNG